MPIRKFRSVEEMNQPNWRHAGDPQLYRAMAVVWDLARHEAILFGGHNAATYNDELSMVGERITERVR